MSIWLQRLRAVFGKRRLDDDLDQEFAFHMEMEAAENERRGMIPEEARRQARRSFGGLQQTQETYRDRRGIPLLETSWRGLCFGIRSLLRNPVLAVVAVLSLALGIGANTAIFSLVDAVLLRSLPVDAPEQLVFFGGARRGLIVDLNVPPTDLFSYPRYQALRESLGGLNDLAASASFSMDAYVRDKDTANGPPERASVRLVSGNYFEVLGVRPALGRLLREDDEAGAGAKAVAILGHGYWERRYGGDAGVVGTDIRINDHSFAIVGITPPGFHGETVGDSPDIWVPATMQQSVVLREMSIIDRPAFVFLLLVGRLHDGVTVEQVTQAATTQYKQIVASETGYNPDEQGRRQLDELKLAAIPGERGLSNFRARYDEALFVLMSVAGLVLLIACANIANLLLARATARRQEIGIRLALGAGRARLIRQLLTESLALAAVGGIAGVLFARWASRFLLTMISSGDNVIPIDVQLDTRVLAFALGVSVLTALLFGLAPALRATRIDPAPTLHGAARGEAGSRFGLSKGLIVAQVAVSLLLLIGAGLFLRTLDVLESANLGYDMDGIVTASIDPEGAGYPRQQLHGFYDRVLERIEAIPGVRSASLSFRPLLQDLQRNQSIAVDGYTFQENESAWMNIFYMTPGYVGTVGMQVVEGRAFEKTDRRGSPWVAMINERFAHRFFPAGSPLGRTIRVDGGDNGQDVTAEIIGVLRDANIYDARREPSEMVFLSGYQTTDYLQCLNIRTSGGNVVQASEIRRALAEVDPNLPVREILSMNARLAENLRQERVLTRLTGFFGAVALLLAAIGLYGVMSYTVARRTKEIGLRMALGAGGWRVLWTTLRESLAMIGTGMMAGLIAALALTRLIVSLLHNVSALDPIAIGGAAVVLALVAVVAALLPAWRASQVDPTVALRHE